MRTAVRAILGLILVLSATGCGVDDPLSADRDEGAWFRLNPAVAVVDAGATTKVTAIVVNKHTAAINAPVTAEPCDSKITAEVDETRTEYEPPERFVVTGMTLGESCLIVRGAGLTDTTLVRVVPASISASGVDTVLSGATGNIAVQFRNSAGASVTGFTNAQLSFTALDPTIAVVTSAGVVSGQAPGTGRIVVSTIASTGAQRVDTVFAVVKAGTFTGAVAVGTAGATNATATAVSFTQGAIPFDSDTQVRILSGSNVVTTYKVPGTAASVIQLALPYSLAAGTFNYEVSNIGPNQVAAIGTINLPAGTPAEDAFGPDEDHVTSQRSMIPGQAAYGTQTGTDVDDFIKLTITEAGNYRFSTAWNDGSDVDVLLRNSTNTAYVNTSMATIANPEAATIALQPGVYWIWLNMYEWIPNGETATTYAVTVIKL